MVVDSKAGEEEGKAMVCNAGGRYVNQYVGAQTEK